jgi:hypothetical protein
MPLAFGPIASGPLANNLGYTFAQGTTPKPTASVQASATAAAAIAATTPKPTASVQASATAAASRRQRRSLRRACRPAPRRRLLSRRQRPCPAPVSPLARRPLPRSKQPRRYPQLLAQVAGITGQRMLRPLFIYRLLWICSMSEQIRASSLEGTPCS